MRIIRRSELIEGLWRNGLGISWDIASEKGDANTGDFGWRFAIARIDGDVPFSRYPGVDRIFTLLEGHGLDLEFGCGERLAVDRPFVPHFYPCDVPTFCHLRNGSCLALNLFVARGQWSATVQILSSNAEIDHPGPILLFALDGAGQVDGRTLEQGDTALTEDQVVVSPGASQVYVAKLAPA